MLARKHRDRNRLRRATAMVQAVVFGSVVGVGIAALSVDTGLMFASKQELQNAADAAALAAASQLGASGDPTSAAAQEAALYASQNAVAGLGVSVDVETDLVFGHAVLNGEKYDFLPDEQPYDAVRVTLRRDQTAADGPVSLLFAKMLGVESADLVASATAMLVPRDIAVVIDFSASMNDDSELRHYKQYPSENGGTRPGVQVNLKECWQALGSPTWGQLNNWGSELLLGSYNPTSDPGLWKVQKSSSCTETAVNSQLLSRGYSSAEASALMSGSGDSTGNRYRNRVKVILGVAEWQSGKSGGKYGTSGGNGDNYVDDSELTAKLNFPYPSGTSHNTWNSYVDYVAGTSQMTSTDSNFRYRFGLKTFVNYLLEKRPSYANTPVLYMTPAQPLQAVKDAVQEMISLIVELETQDHVSLEAFAQYGTHLHNLTVPSSPSLLPLALQEIPDTLNCYQAGHFTAYTNIGAGFERAFAELTSTRARTAAAKVVILLTDGKPNINSAGSYVGENAPEAVNWAAEQANALKNLGATVYVVGVGGDVNPELCASLASRPENYFFADSTPDPDNNNQPLYVTKLQEIFQTLGGKRPVRLIQ